MANANKYRKQQKQKQIEENLGEEKLSREKVGGIHYKMDSTESSLNCVFLSQRIFNLKQNFMKDC